MLQSVDQEAFPFQVRTHAIVSMQKKKGGGDESTVSHEMTQIYIFKVILVGTGGQLKLRKHPNAYIAI
jgi:hypothetical protein